MDDRNASSSVGAIPNTESWHAQRKEEAEKQSFFLGESGVWWLTARAKGLENTLMLFRGCQEPGPFTSLISWFLFFWLGSAVVKQPSGAQKSHVLAKEKMGEMRQNKLPKQKGKKQIYCHFSPRHSELGKPAIAALQSIIHEESLQMKWYNCCCQNFPSSKKHQALQALNIKATDDVPLIYS